MKPNAKPYFLNMLEENFSRKQKINPVYSLRSFAKHLRVDPSTLSAIFKGHRLIPKNRAENIADRLGLSPQQKERFCMSIVNRKASLSELAKIKMSEDHQTILDSERHFNILAEWEYYAVLSLVRTADFRYDPKWVAERLGIGEMRARVVIKHLIEAGFLSVDKNNKLGRKVVRLETTEDVVSVALRKSHKEAMVMGIDKLEKIDIQDRDYSSFTAPIDMENLVAAKTLIREFRQKLASLLERGKPTEVYQVCIQFFPLTELKMKKGEPHGNK